VYGAGRAAGREVTCEGYVEMTGYAGSLAGTFLKGSRESVGCGVATVEGRGSSEELVELHFALTSILC